MRKYKKECFISLFVIGCILLNLGGKLFAAHFRLPLWMDSFGTALAAYALGPVCGAIVGVSINIIYGILVSYTYIVYGLVSAAIGVIIGICAKKGYLDYLFGVLSVSFFVTLLSAVISCGINYLFFAGAIGNVWGDGIYKFFGRIGWNPVFCHILGQFYVEFADKVLTLFALYVVVKLRKHARSRKHTMKKTAGFTVLLLCLVSATAFPAHAKTVQDEEASIPDYTSYIQTVYNVDSGLPGGMANDIAQTKDGVLWIGTYSGLYRYSGSEFQLMEGFDSVKNANCLYADESGRLWIGTNDSGLSICINESLSNVMNEDSGLPSDSVRCITQCADGSYYVGTTDALAIVTLTGGLRVRDTIDEITYAGSISADENGYVAVVSDEGTLSLIHEAQVVDSKEGYTCCVFAADGSLYAGTADGSVHVFAPQQGEKAGQLKKSTWVSCKGLSNLKSLKFLENGVLFVCADNGIGYVTANQEYHAVNTDEFNSSIDHMMEDYQGNLWFTSSRLGLLRLCESVFSEIPAYKELGESVVNTITVWNKRMYVGTDHGLCIIRPDGTAEKEEPLMDLFAGVRVRCLRTDQNNHLWVATSGRGVYELTTSGEIRCYGSQNGASGDKFRMTLELDDGTIVAAGDAGITFIRDGKIVHTIGSAQGLKNPRTLCLLQRDDGQLYAGTDGDGIAVIENGKIVHTLGKSDGLGSEVILRMVEEKNGDGMFIVTSNSICYMDGSGSIRLLNNFNYYNNYDLVENDTGEVFILGSAGIYVVDKEDLLGRRKPDYELLDRKKGLQKGLTPNSWNYIDGDNNLYLATDSGVLYLNLEQYDVAARSYRMLLKSVLVDGVSYEVERGEPIHIPSGASRIDFLPEIVNYSINNPYVSVWLEGFDENPQILLQSELSELSYTNLPAGNYTFHLAVLDNRGKTAIAESAYEVVREKEIYDQWWFLVYVIAVFALAIMYLTWLFFRTQVQRTLNMQKRELELVQKQVEMGNETILTIAKTVDAKDENTSQHSIRVSEYSVLIAQKLGLDEQTCDELRRTALLHDIGKIAIPDRVLNKPSRLTDEEYEIMKSHVVKGADILKNFTLLDHVEEGALYHHERYDGKGYVHGLKGEEIPLYARIIGIADAFDAMTANRVYRKQLDFDYVLGELKKGRGTQFDPKLVDIMLELIAEGTIDIKKLYEKKHDVEQTAETALS